MPKDKFKTNPFAKKYKEELETETGGPSPMPFGPYDQMLESANQVKSWKRSPISQTVNLTYIFLAFIIGFSLCAVVMTPIIISAI